MSCNRSKTSVMLLQPLKHTEASKLWWIQPVATLWLEVRPTVPSAAAWSEHSFPRFPLWPYTCCTVSRICVDRKSWTVHMRLPAAHAYEPGSCPSKHQQHADNHNKYTTAHHGLLDHEEDQENLMLQSWQSFRRCCWSVRAPEKARWASMVTTGPNMTSILPWRDREIKHHPAIKDASTSICINSPSTVIIASFTCCGTSIGQIRISGFELLAGGSFGAGPQVCVEQDKLPDMRERKQEWRPS